MIKNMVDGHKKYSDGNAQAIDHFLIASEKRYSISHSSDKTRSHWQNHELFTLIQLFLGELPRILVKDPIKIPSGKYVETLRVERTQQDLNNEMVGDLSTLPRRHAYVKIMQETGVVATHKIATKELPPARESDIETLVRLAGYDFCKKRDDIQKEIKERQSRWQGGSGPPSQAKRIR